MYGQDFNPFCDIADLLLPRCCTEFSSLPHHICKSLELSFFSSDGKLGKFTCTLWFLILIQSHLNSVLAHAKYGLKLVKAILTPMFAHQCEIWILNTFKINLSLCKRTRAILVVKSWTGVFFLKVNTSATFWYLIMLKSWAVPEILLDLSCYFE